MLLMYLKNYICNSVAELRYKRFKNPIVWTYTVSGGTDIIYSYVNAKGADNYGVDVDIRKNLEWQNP